MNCISGLILIIVLLISSACSAPASESPQSQSSNDYRVHYTVTPRPSDGKADIVMRVEQSRGQLREVSFSVAAVDRSSISGDGGISVTENRLFWIPGNEGGDLQWSTDIVHQRGDGGYDAWLDGQWGLFRAEDVIPRARTRTLKGASSRTTMSFALPQGWSAVTEYSTLHQSIDVSNPERRFDQPSGWIGMGKLGIRRENIAGTRISVVAPEGHDVRRMDMLALFNWTLPEIRNLLPNSLPRLTVFSAADPMWRGGLSAPSSIYIHADRPLISENATSTLVHETMHVALGIRAADGFDWIVEGLAEYYSLEMLYRGGAITPRRYRRALEDLETWAKDAKSLCGANSKGAVTALAVVTFRNLNDELEKKTMGRINLDQLAAAIWHSRNPVSIETLSEIVTHLLQEPADSLRIDALPGCKRYLSKLET